MGVCSSYVLKSYVIIILTKVIIARIVKEQVLLYWIKTKLTVKKKNSECEERIFEDELNEDCVTAFLTVVVDDDDDDDDDANRNTAVNTMASIACTAQCNNLPS